MSRRDITLADVGLQEEETADQRQGRKYGNKITEVDGIKFKSQWESEFYSQLKLREQAGEIVEMKRQTTWVLQEGFRDIHGKHWRPISYVDDFSFLEVDTGKFVVVDTKGFETEAFRIKLKLFIKRYPGIEFRRETRRGRL